MRKKQSPNCIHCGKEAMGFTLEDVVRWKAQKISVSQQARFLRISRATLFRKIKALREAKYGPGA